MTTAVAPTGRTGLAWLLRSAGAAVTAQGIIAAAAPLLAASLTRQGWVVGLVAAAAWLPWLLVGLVAGAFVDRTSRRVVMVVTDAVRGVLLLGFAAWLAAGHASVWGLGAVVFLVGVGSCFFDPAAQAEIPALVGRDSRDLDTANATYWTIDTIARTLVGASAAGLLYAAADWLPFATAGVLLVASGVMVSRLPRDHTPAGAEPPDGARTALLADVASGARLVHDTPALRDSAVLMAAYNLVWNLVFGTFVLVVLDHHHVGARAWGVLVATGALGGLAGGAFAKRVHWDLRTAYGWAFLAQGAGWLGSYYAPTPWLVAIGLVLIGAASTVVSSVGGTAVHTVTPDGWMARVTSVVRLFGIGSAALGSALSGAAVSALGLPGPTLLAAAALGALGAWTLTHR